MFDTGSAAEFLRQRGYAVDERSVEAVGHGEWSRAFLFSTTDRRDLVARFSATDADFRKDQVAQRLLAGRVGVPCIERIEPTDSGFVAISERAYGAFIEDRDAAAMARLLPSLFGTLDVLRETRLDEATGFGLWDHAQRAPHPTWRDFLLHIDTDVPSARTHGWKQKLPLWPDSQRAFERGYARLSQLIDACPEQRHLVHSDLLNFNVLVTGDRITAVLDWGSALFGDFVWDVAWFTFWQPWYVAWSGVAVRDHARQHYMDIGLDVVNFDERLRCYELAIGLDGLAYQSWVGHADNLAWTTAHLQSIAG